MDETRAQAFHKEFSGQELAEWTIGDLLGWGKSGVVFRAQRDDNHVAFKVFDPELVGRFGEVTQLSRLNRELSLVGKRHPNLVEILDGGKIESHELLYIVMQEVQAPTVEKVVSTIHREAIRSTLSQIAKAARFLEEQGLVHRDIKPANVALDPDTDTATLLDLGVLRPISGSDLTDTTDAVQFIATLRYSSPEYLLREEDDSPEGWRALTFYQLGGILHDMIMRTRLFEEHSEPYARLVNAVQHQVPHIVANDVFPDLVQLAQNCLVKDPSYRLELVSWDDFEMPEPSMSDVESAKERIQRRLSNVDVASLSTALQESEQQERDMEQSRQDVCNQIQSTIRSICAGIPVFPPVALSERKEDAQVEIIVEFAASTEKALHKAYQFRLGIRVFDAIEQLVTVRLLDPDEPEDLNSSKIIFKGVFDAAGIRTVLGELLHTELDKAQVAADSGEDSERP